MSLRTVTTSDTRSTVGFLYQYIWCKCADAQCSRLHQWLARGDIQGDLLLRYPVQCRIHLGELSSPEAIDEGHFGLPV